MRVILSVSLMVFATVSFSQPQSTTSRYLPCLSQTDLQQERSRELKTLVDADQKEREDWDKLSEDEKQTVSIHDMARRKRVGEIFGEGCFKSAQDYAAAALIYQHGDTPDHYYQAFVWANRAVNLGDTKSRHLAALTIDRYLVSIGKKQLFGSQAFASDETNWCFCLQPVEKSFPDDRRKDYSGRSLKENVDMVLFLNEGKDCPNIECPGNLKPTPEGSVPGFW
ncbi:Uncharacterised protein [Legionella spiritensis]|nr:Uncharacterised protein [Legionella spiritensis]